MLLMEQINWKQILSCTRCFAEGSSKMANRCFLHIFVHQLYLKRRIYNLLHCFDKQNNFGYFTVIRHVLHTLQLKRRFDIFCMFLRAQANFKQCHSCARSLAHVSSHGCIDVSCLFQIKNRATCLFYLKQASCPIFCTSFSSNSPICCQIDFFCTFLTK